MLFNSWIFLPFILIVLGLYYRLEHRGQNVMLLVASYVFYGWWDYRFATLLLISTVTDFFLAIWIDREQDHRRRHVLISLSCIVNFGILGFFKYFNFFLGSATKLLDILGLSVPLPALQIILPVGISFYTFQTMNYTLDVYRKDLKPTREFTTFALFVAYFPHMVAGPIMRAADLIPQLALPRRVTRDQVISGLWLCLWGFFKKLVVADNLAVLTDNIFAQNASGISGVQSLLGVYAFAYQIYCDFSGYSDIARGLSKLMGIELMMNFNRPYQALNPSDFWRRWHISLSTWLRDYLYIALGGSRGTRFTTYRNLVVTMLLGGLWHGAAWHFVWWGAFHGAILVIHRLLVRDRGHREAVTVWGRVLSRLVMFHVTCVGWLLFRADTMQQVATMLYKMATDFTWDSRAAPLAFGLFFYVGWLWVFETWLRNADDPRTRPGWSRGGGALAIAVLGLLLLVFSAEGGHQFIYFQF